MNANKSFQRVFWGFLTVLFLAACGTPVSKEKISEVDGMVLMYVPEGDFIMGSDNGKPDERPAHTVYLDAFWIDQTEVTNEMFRAFVNDTGYKTEIEDMGWSYVYGAFVDKPKVEDEISGADWEHPLGPESNIEGIENHPVVNVTWNDATAYCKWAGRRLPTEAEWEKAARGTEGATYPWGNGDVTDGLLNFADVNIPGVGSDNSIDDGYKMTSPAGSYPQGASPYGVLDMAGNVLEWVADWYEVFYYASSPESNPTGPTSGVVRVARGGSWVNDAMNARSFFRIKWPPQTGGNDSGFRCAASE